jgi:hypothetical protein
MSETRVFDVDMKNEDIFVCIVGKIEENPQKKSPPPKERT